MMCCEIVRICYCDMLPRKTDMMIINKNIVSFRPSEGSTFDEEVIWRPLAAEETLN